MSVYPVSSVPDSAGVSPPDNTPKNAAPVIADVTYRNYDGELRTRGVRWWIVAVATMRASINKSRFGYWIPAALILIIYLALGIGFYITQGFRARMGAGAAMMGLDEVNSYAVTLYQCFGASSLLVFVAALLVGSNVIAADNRANALLVYLSKPLTRVDYLVGKWVGVFLQIAALTVLPSLFMFMFFATAYYSDGFLKENPSLIWRLLGVTLLLPALHTSLIIGFSSWTKSPRLAGSLYAAFYFVTFILSGTFGLILQGHDKEKTNPQTAALVTRLHVDGVAQGLALHLYQITPQQVSAGPGGRRRNRRPRRNNDAAQNAAKDATEAAANEPPVPSVNTERPPLLPLLGLASAMIGLPVWAAWTKVKAVEIISG